VPTGYLLGQPYSDGRTSQHTALAKSPAAGSGFSTTLATYDKQRVVFIRFTLTTSSTVADRYVTVDYIGPDGVAKATDGAAVAVEASTTSQVFAGSLHRGNSEWNNASAVFFPLCGIWLEPGTLLQINVANIDTTDQLSNIKVTLDRTPVEPELYGDEDVADKLNLTAKSLVELAELMRISGGSLRNGG
jgi:hypothetical protein